MTMPLCNVYKENVFNPVSLLNTIGKELECLFGSRGITNGGLLMEVENLSQKEKLTSKQIAKACDLLGGDDDLRVFLCNFQKNYLVEKKKALEAYRKSKKNYTRLKVVLPLLRNEFDEGVDRLDDILDFFDVQSEDEIFNEAESTAALFRLQNNCTVDPVNLRAWLRRGELDFSQMNLQPYDETRFLDWIDSRQWEVYIEDENYFKELPKILSKFGVGIIYVPYLPNTVYGAVRWMNGKPLVQISDRNQDLATCWFTLFHEFGHVILHRDFDTFEGSINDSKSASDHREKEANKFANKYLFNGDDLRKEVFRLIHDGEYIVSSCLATKYNVNNILVAYWLIKAQYQVSFQKRIHVDFASMYQ